MKEEFLYKWGLKIVVFSFIGMIFYFGTPSVGPYMYLILVFSACCWFVYEYRKNRKIVGKALLLGLFLMIFDFLVQNAGSVLGLWKTFGSVLFVLSVPVEIMVLCVVGGAAWAMHVPERFDKIYVLGDSIIFGLYGAVGEMLLIKNGLMEYMGWWNFSCAFFGYFVAWWILSFVWYKVLRITLEV